MEKVKILLSGRIVYAFTFCFLLVFSMVSKASLTEKNQNNKQTDIERFIGRKNATGIRLADV